MMDVVEQPQHRQQRKPIPKPRKFLLKNNALLLESSTGQSGAGTSLNGVPSPPPTRGAQQDANSLASSSPASTIIDPPPPPLPPRPSLAALPERPLPPVPGTAPITIHSHSLLTNFQKIDPKPNTPASSDQSCDQQKVRRQRLYPNLDELLLGTASGPEDLLMMKCNGTGKGSPSSASSTSSNFPSSSSSSASSSDDSPPHIFHSSSSVAVAASSSSAGPYTSFCEPFGADAQSDGESVCFSGWVQFAVNGTAKQRKRGWALIRNNHFCINQDDESQTPLYGPVDMSKCVYLGKTAANEGAEITLALRKEANKAKAQQKSVPNLNDQSLQLLRFRPEENLECWLALLAKCCSPKNDIFREELPMVDCCGKLWVKQGISGHWNEGWAYVLKRVVHYWLQGPNAVADADIRKIFLVKQSDIPRSDWCNRIEHSVTGPMLIALEGRSLYLQSEFDQCTSLWLELLNSELKKDANTLEECRLTAEDVPVIVDKCIGLVSTYGMFQPGIYRKNGSAAEAKRIIQEFREDPYNVYLKAPISDELINAVADVLRTFFRQLATPLIPVELHSHLYEISNFPLGQKVAAYKELINTLPRVHYRTLRKLLCHLHEIVSHEDRNLASLDNIARVFGPTLFNVSNSDQQISVEFYNMATKQAAVINDLVHNFCEIFDVSADELLAKCKLDIVRDQKASKNPANGLLVPIHLFERDNKCFNVQSEWTASQVVSFKVQKLASVSPCESYALFEMVRDGQLERRIEANELLRSIVLGRWLDWDEPKRNFLLLKKDTHPFEPQSGRAFAEDLKLAEPGSRSFKAASLRIEDGIHVCHYSKAMKRQARCKLDEVLWFVGAEAERRCPHPYALTFFVSEEKRAAKCTGKWPGYCVAFKDELQRLQWLNQVIVSTQEYLPMPIIQI